MPALPTTSPTLIDWQGLMGPDGSPARFANMLALSNPILQDMPFMEGNLEVGHQTSVLTGLPTVAWRLMNGGVLPSKATFAPLTEQTGMLEAYSQIDVDLAKLNGNTSSYRMSATRPFFEAMNQEMGTTMFYGSAQTPEKFVGLSPRFSSLAAGNGRNIIDGGGVQSDNSSIWLISWGDESITGIFPKGSTAGLIHEDMGIQLIQNTAGVQGALNRFYVDHWQWKMGIAMADWRFVVRIANIDISNLVGATTPADLIDLMERSLSLLPNEYGRSVFYMNRTLARFLRAQARADVTAGGGLTYENVTGQRILTFGDIPVRIVDALLNTEARVI